MLLRFLDINGLFDHQLLLFRIARILLALSLLSFTHTLTADTIYHPLTEKITISAEFVQGDNTLPAVLILHGFLQTHHFRLIEALAEQISDLGYTTLAPTLSLNINRRRQSLPCEAIHTHSMQDDVNEITHWVDWLIAQGHQQVILIGHSYGALNLLVYLSQHNNQAKIKQLIAISLVDFSHGIGKKTPKTHYTRHQKYKLNEYSFSYCKKYISPEKAYQSYAKWQKPRILNSLRRLKSNIQIIIGDHDERMGSQWPDELKKTGAHISIIQGANHFFDAQFEFDLNDKVEQLLQQLQ